jgi:choline kinase
MVTSSEACERISGAIIAAGRGERLRRAVDGLPKPLVELAGEPLLIRQIRALIAIGADPVHVVVNRETSSLIAQRGLKIPMTAQLFARDTANSLESLLVLGERISAGYFVMATVDAILPHGQLQRFVDRARTLTNKGSEEAGGFDGALGVVRWRGDRRPLYAEVAADGLIRGLGKGESHLVTAGVYFFSTRIFDHGHEARALHLQALRSFLALLVEKGTRFAAIKLEGVIDIDEADDLYAARAALAGRS